MPFGLINAPTVFQHMMNDVFTKFLDDFIFIYIDNILIYLKNIEDHEKHVCMVLKKLCDMELYAKQDKCEFHQLQVEFLGYKVFSKGVSMNPKKVQIIIDWIIPSTICYAQCFLGFVNFYKIFIKYYSNFFSFLINFTCKDKFK